MEENPQAYMEELQKKNALKRDVIKYVLIALAAMTIIGTILKLGVL